MTPLSRTPGPAPTPGSRAPAAATLAAIGGAGLAAAGTSVGLALYNDQDQPPIQVVLTTWITLPYVISGLVAWRRRPDSRFGPLMVAAGFGIALSTLQWATVPLLHSVGHLFDLLPAVLFLHVFLAYPTGRLRRQYERGLVAFGYAAALGLQVVVLMLGGLDPLDVFTVASRPALADSLHNLQLVALGLTCFAGVVVLATRRAGGRRTSLRPAALLVDAFALGLVALGVLLLAGAFQWPVFAQVRLFAFAAIGLAPIAFLVGVLDARLARSGVGDLLVELRAHPALDLREPLARALRDPSVQLAYWLPQYSSWADRDGNPVTLPPVPGERSTTLIERDGEPVAALIHDPVLTDEPELLEAVTAAAAIALENERLQAELKARLQELQGSRSRVIEAGQSERKRLERNLHDGAQQRLVALSLELAMLGNRLGDDPDARARVERAKDQVTLSLGELRDLARGIHPAVLSAQRAAGGAAVVGRAGPAAGPALRPARRPATGAGRGRGVLRGQREPDEHRQARRRERGDRDRVAGRRSRGRRHRRRRCGRRRHREGLRSARSRRSGRSPGRAAADLVAGRPRDPPARGDPVRVAIAEDSVLLREGLARLLGRCRSGGRRPLRRRRPADGRRPGRPAGHRDRRRPASTTHTDEGIRAAPRSGPPSPPSACWCCRSTSRWPGRWSCSPARPRGWATC